MLLKCPDQCLYEDFQLLSASQRVNYAIAEDESRKSTKLIKCAIEPRSPRQKKQPALDEISICQKLV